MLETTFREQRKDLEMLQNAYEGMDEAMEILEMKEDEKINNEIKDIKVKNLEPAFNAFAKVKEITDKLEINNRLSYVKFLREEARSRKENKTDGKTIERLESVANMIENLFSLEDLISNKTLLKYNRERCANVRKQSRSKLSKNKKLAFIDPYSMEKAIKEVFNSKESNKLIFIVYSYIANVKLEEKGLYIHFLLLALSSINREDMLDREVVIENLKKLL